MHENESVPVIMLDPDDVQIVTAAQSSIRQSMLYIQEVLLRYLPAGATTVTAGTNAFVFAAGPCVTASMQVRNGWGPDAVVGWAHIDDLSTDTILRAFDRACADFKAQMGALDETRPA